MKNYNTQEGAVAARATIIAALVIIIAAGVGYLLNDTSEKDAMMQDTMVGKDTEVMHEGDVMDEGEMMKEGEVMQEGDAMEGDGMMIEYSGSVLAGSSAPLLDFTQSDYEEALNSDKLIVLYFYASWCPICKVETEEALYPAFNTLDTNQVIGFRVNFNDGDTDAYEKSLASEFGVAYQHTKVFVKNGERILKSPESWNESRYLSEIENAL